MPVKSYPTFSATKTSRLEIPQPGVGGLNLYDLEYEQEVNQSPYMLNMMYRNGTFSKRYGQSVKSTYSSEVYAIEYFDGKLMVHTGTQMLVDGVASTITPSATQGKFMKFYQTLLYYCGSTIYEYKYDYATSTWSWGTMEYYVPTCFINCELNKKYDPGSSTGGTYDRLDDLNILESKYICEYDGDGSNKVLYAYGDDEDIIDWTNAVSEIKVDEVVTTAYTIDTTNKKVTLTNTPAEGSNNITVTWNLKSSIMEDDRTRILASKYNITYGANGSSHLFLAGGGSAKIFYSDSYDHTYFPENNWMILGLSEDDVTGFGLEYNVMIVFKPRELYSLYSYNLTSSMLKSEDEDDIGTEAFGSQIVNSQIGCDAPYTIQLLNNQLTWFNSKEGVCTLVSTNVSDERNVRIISRNINRTNNMGVVGILDIDTDLTKVVSVDHDYKYFLCFPKKYENGTLVDYGMCYVWDYAIAPFTYTASKVTDPKTLDWFLFDNFHVKQFLTLGKDLIYISNKTCKVYNTQTELLEDKYLTIKVGDSYSDIDLTDTRKSIGINAHYMTPFLQFNAVEYLKTVKNIFIQCRGDTASVIDMYYYTDSSTEKEDAKSPIRIGGRIWQHFEWINFQWLSVNWANTFRRKCNLKKIQMCAFYFECKDKYESGVLTESMAGRDMSITHIAMEYQVVKTVR